MTYRKLKELGLKHGTDKATSHSYLQIYAKVFDSLELVDKNIKILEIGAGDTGASHKMWAEYFPKADVFCIDPFHLSAQNKNLKEELKLFGVN